MADDASTCRQRLKHNEDVIRSEVGRLAIAVERARSDALRQCQLRIETVEKDISAKIDQLRDAEALLHREQTNIRVSIHEGVSSVAAESRAVSGKMKFLETTLTSRSDALDRRMRDIKLEVNRRYEATAHALQSFADILHVSMPVAMRLGKEHLTTPVASEPSPKE